MILLAIAFFIFLASCFVLGFFAGFFVAQYKWAIWFKILSSFVIALLWPAVVVGMTIYDARSYQQQGPNDPADGPALLLVSVITIAVPFLFLCGFPPAFVGTFFGARQKLEEKALL